MSSETTSWRRGHLSWVSKDERLLGIRENELVGAKPDSSYIETQQQSGLRNTVSFSHYSPHVNHRSFSHYSPHVNHPGGWPDLLPAVTQGPRPFATKLSSWTSLQLSQLSRLHFLLPSCCSLCVGNSCLHHVSMCPCCGSKKTAWSWLVSSLKSGWIHIQALPRLILISPSSSLSDKDSGLAQPSESPSYWGDVPAPSSLDHCNSQNPFWLDECRSRAHTWANHHSEGNGYKDWSSHSCTHFIPDAVNVALSSPHWVSGKGTNRPPNENQRGWMLGRQFTNDHYGATPFSFPPAFPNSVLSIPASWPRPIPSPG